MSLTSFLTVLVIGATGSIGRHVVEQALQQGHKVRALVRNVAKAGLLPSEVEIVVGDITRPEKLNSAVDGVDAIVLPVNADGQGKAAAEAVYYGGVRDILVAVSSRTVRIALMTAIGVTERLGHYNRANEGHDWKRRAERLVRTSGQAYTIIRPGWFDYNTPDQQRIVMLQGDRRHSGTPEDGAIARRQVAEALVSSLTSKAALCKTFELIAEKGAAQDRLEPLFAALDADADGALDAIRDLDNMPFKDEPQRVRDDIAMLSACKAANTTKRE